MSEQSDIVLVPVVRWAIKCPNCKGNNVRVFPLLVAPSEPEQTSGLSSHLCCQGYCQDCGLWILVMVGQYPIDTSFLKPDGHEKSILHFSALQGLFEPRIQF